MNTAIPKSLSHLPDYVKGSNGNIRQDLLIPADKRFRESYKEGKVERVGWEVDLYKTSVKQSLIPDELSQQRGL